MSGEYLVLFAGNGLLMAGGAAALGLGELHIPRYLRRRAGAGAAVVMAVAALVTVLYLLLGALIFRYAFLGFRENIAPYLGMGYGRRARHLVLASLFVAGVVAVYVPIFFHQRIRRFRRTPRAPA